MRLRSLKRAPCVVKLFEKIPLLGTRSFFNLSLSSGNAAHLTPVKSSQSRYTAHLTMATDDPETTEVELAGAADFTFGYLPRAETPLFACVRESRSVSSVILCQASIDVFFWCVRQTRNSQSCLGWLGFLCPRRVRRVSPTSPTVRSL